MHRLSAPTDPCWPLKAKRAEIHVSVGIMIENQRYTCEQRPELHQPEVQYKVIDMHEEKHVDYHVCCLAVSLHRVVAAPLLRSGCDQ